MASLPNKGQNYALKMVQVWLAVPMCLFWAIGIRIIRKMGRYKNKQIDDKLDSSSDYLFGFRIYHQVNIMNYSW